MKKTLRLMFLHPAPPKLAQVFKYTNRCGKPMGFPRKMIHTWCVFHIYVSFPQASSFIVFYIRTLSRYHPASLISRSYLEHVLFGRKWTTKFTGSKRRRKTRWNGSCLFFFLRGVSSILFTKPYGSMGLHGSGGKEYVRCPHEILNKVACLG